MQKAMTIKGFAVLLALILAVFLGLHLVMQGDMHRKAEEENVLRIALAKANCKDITKEDVHALIDEIYEEYQT